MILDRLEAKNFGRYRTLTLEELPRRGLLGIVGPNESGKTTIGDVICFALFGRTATDRVPEEHIHWKEAEMSVRLEFRDPDDVPWRIVREIDRSGTYSATLERLDGGDGEPVRGVGKVQHQIERLLRLDFDEFTYAFFLGQKELDAKKQLASDAKRHLVDELTGVGTIERVVDEVSEGLDELIGRRSALEERTRLTSHLLDEYRARVAPAEHDDVASLDELRTREEQLVVAVGEHETTLEHAEAYARCSDKLRNYLLSLKAKAAAFVLARRKAWLARIEGTLARQLTETEAELETFGETGRRREAFRAKLRELASVVTVRHNQIKRALENRLPADIPPGDEELLAPDGRIEQLVVTRLRSNRAAETAESFVTQRNQFLIALLVASAAAALCYLYPRPVIGVLTTSALYWVFMVSATIFFVYAGVFTVRARHQLDRVERLRDTATHLEADVAKLREASRLCEEFDVDRLAGLDDRLERIGGGLLTEYHRELAEQFEDFLSGRSDYLRSQRGAERLAAQVAELREDLVEVRHTTADLEGWLARFSSNPFFKLPTVEDDGAEKGAFERSSFQQSVKRLNREIDGCQKVLFLLENDCRSPVSNRICSSFRDFQQTLDELAVLVCREHKLQLDELQVVQRGEFADLDDPVDFVAKQEQRLSAFCPSNDQRFGEPDVVRKDLAEAREALGKVRLDLAEAEQRLARLEPDAARCRQLERDIDDARIELTGVERAIRVREILLELLTGLAERMRERLAPALADYVRCVLPRITGYRYRDVQLTEDLDIQVYSPEKGDYVHLEDLSGGTVDQLLMSLRLAFARALMDAKLRNEPHQFLFFDEPLSSFDRSRAEAFLALLRSFGDTVAQVCLVAHLGGLDELCDRVGFTHLDRDSLVMSVAAGAEAGTAVERP